LVAANLNSKKSRIDFSLPKTLIARHEFITDKSNTATIAPGGDNQRENSIARK
jgi:hypothetical protein